MNANISRDNDQLNIEIEGRLDTVAAPELEKQIGKIPEDVKLVNIDLKKLDYIASSGLRVLLSILKSLKAQGGEVVLYNPNDLIFEILETTGFTDIFEIKEN